MTVWLARQDAIWRFQAYLDWSEHEPIIVAESDHGQADADNEDDGEDSLFNDEDAEGDDGEEEECEDESGTESNSHSKVHPLTSSGFVIAKCPAYPGTSVATLIADFRTQDLITKTNDFLQTHCAPSQAPCVPLDTSAHFPVYKQVKLTMPVSSYVSQFAVVDTIQCTPPKPAKGAQPAVPGHFTTVFALDPQTGTSESVSQELNPLNSKFLEASTIFQ